MTVLLWSTTTRVQVGRSWMEPRRQERPARSPTVYTTDLHCPLTTAVGITRSTTKLSTSVYSSSTLAEITSITVRKQVCTISVSGTTAPISRTTGLLKTRMQSGLASFMVTTCLTVLLL